MEPMKKTQTNGKAKHVSLVFSTLGFCAIAGVAFFVSSQTENLKVQQTESDSSKDVSLSSESTAARRPRDAVPDLQPILGRYKLVRSELKDCADGAVGFMKDGEADWDVFFVISRNNVMLAKINQGEQIEPVEGHPDKCVYVRTTQTSAETPGLLVRDEVERCEGYSISRKVRVQGFPDGRLVYELDQVSNDLGKELTFKASCEWQKL